MSSPAIAIWPARLEIALPRDRLYEISHPLALLQNHSCILDPGFPIPLVLGEKIQIADGILALSRADASIGGRASD